MNGRSFVILFSGLAIIVSLFLIGNDAGWFRRSNPPVFDAHPEFEAARAVAAETDRLLVVDMTATWCPPCREMDRSVWVDAELEEYLANHTVAVQVDVDEHPEIASLFDVRSIPTIIAVDVRRSLELDRQSTLVEAPALLQWLKQLDESRRLLPPAATALVGEESPQETDPIADPPVESTGNSTDDQ